MFSDLKSKEYIAKKHVGSLDETLKLSLIIDEYLKKLFMNEEIIGFEYRILKSTEDIYDEDLDFDEINEINKGIFPCIWINITYKPHTLPESKLIIIEQKLHLLPL